LIIENIITLLEIGATLPAKVTLTAEQCKVLLEEIARLKRLLDLEVSDE
jgi:hypothetical protein